MMFKFKDPMKVSKEEVCKASVEVYLRPERLPNEPLGSILAPFWASGQKGLQMSLWGPFWLHFGPRCLGVAGHSAAPPVSPKRANDYFE